ncbi:hypothetical protein [Ponticaulis sp.]|uniref:hypothetical protein n=1 Tax=Ponticaulis sp. TaxID=2020902 RepID=UPI000B6C16E9|nr:hypothetical protein [Ponticaulis sp.]MAI90361.1 hypothetical protein [Ponticaulis sp.]OUX99997.1 MAG: hypothetical protein CBB65_07970 [Hyphomonadaceae bacterium TMED5]|tara:strand:+ start:333522 stop:334271 length:750 start_codon:yes stop_codon:yes gene_type:complete
MILGRLATSIRKQDWFTVVIETLIVVFGVYLGIQLGNWNSDNASARSERAVLEQLHEEVLIAQAAIGPGGPYHIERFSEMVQLIFMDIYEGENNLPLNVLCPAVAGSHLVLNPVGELSAVDQLIANGRLSSIRDARLRSAIASFHSLSTKKQARLPELGAITYNLPGLFPEYFSLEPFWAEEEDGVDWTAECDLEAMRADHNFLNLFAINADAYDAWYQSSVMETLVELQALDAHIDRVLGIDHAEADQ